MSIADEEQEWWLQKKEKKKYEPPVPSGEQRPTRLKLLPRSRSKTVGQEGEGIMARGPDREGNGFGAGRGKRIVPPPSESRAIPIVTPEQGGFNVNAPAFFSSTPPNINAPEFTPGRGFSASLPNMQFEDA